MYIVIVLSDGANFKRTYKDIYVSLVHILM